MKLSCIAIVVGAVALTLSSCSEKKTAAKAQVSYPTQVIDLADRTLKSDFAASVTGCQTVEVRPQIDGMLTRICIREGDPVRKGQVLFEIDPAQFQAAYDIAAANVQSAEASVSTARLVLDSNSELYEEKVISDFELNTAKNELAEANARLKLAKAELEKAATNLSYTQVKSPVSGVASMIPYRVGALVSPSVAQPLVTVSDDGEIYAYFSMSESQMLDMVQQYGSMKKAIEDMPEVEFRMSNGRMYPSKGHIDAVSGTINSSTGALSFRAVFPNPDRILRDGGTGTVIIPTAVKDCIVIPQGATYELQDKVFVYKVIDGKASSSEIKVLSQSNGKEYVVTEGLQPGDVIVSEGAGLIKEGTVINAKTDAK
ncbi:efflux RND transporter periplasmic adaptor subunit [Duncaniella freteri]|jgi:membrane fusion protein (multidrug efflux system)|uniref:efflux RND transporter periplasmic adaptor subunit n=2 Tax=Duncaniella TaxID=2518495 RepID=UPI00136EFFFD|nr:efflux RND transporter periplasmic adaptor subunit [Duncaniella freteri]NBJ08808.1 efflux RND transporter periplasmic adaptor subunit [Alistipes sp. Z76]NCE70811.1 efflux RND transporter periplasmic adaptor subunit [Muribaculaceae bacterium M3]